MTLVRKLGWLAFLLAAAGAAVFLGYKTAAPLVWPLPFEGPGRGTVLDQETGRPVPFPEVEAVWLCHDNPLPDGPGHYQVIAPAETDAGGRYQLERPYRRRGFFGTSLVVRFNAQGYIGQVFILDPSGRPLPAETAAYPFVRTVVQRSLPVELEVRLEPAGPVLVRALESDNPLYRAQAAQTLGTWGAGAAFAVGPLMEALADEDATVREAAAAALGSVGSGAAVAVPRLAELLKDDYEWARRKAAWALGEIGPAAAPAVPALALALLDDRERLVREEAARALGKIGPAAAEAVPALKKALQDQDGWVGNEAARALKKITGAGG
ncbi:MAG: HEAT repeat domain-containing protein [Thermodesulfobacteriota bacterium]